jgi:hypothetical protein
MGMSAGDGGQSDALLMQSHQTIGFTGLVDASDQSSTNPSV